MACLHPVFINRNSDLNRIGRRVNMSGLDGENLVSKKVQRKTIRFNRILSTTCSAQERNLCSPKRPTSRADFSTSEKIQRVSPFLISKGFLRVNNVAALGRGSPRDVQVPQFAGLELIDETVHPQVLPARRPRRLHGLRIDDVLDLRADARFGDFRQRLRLRDVLEIERGGERGERRQPARERRRRGWRGRASRDRCEARGGAATVRVTDDENYDRGSVRRQARGKGDGRVNGRREKRETHCVQRRLARRHT